MSIVDFSFQRPSAGFRVRSSGKLLYDVVILVEYDDLRLELPDFFWR